MKAGIVRKSNNSNTSNTIYVMGVAPGDTTEVCILGVTRSSMYGNTPYKRTYFETFEVTGSPTSQALEITDASREFFPLALVVESYNNPSSIRVAERIAFCVETSYVICPFFRQPSSQATDANGHAIAFLKRAKADNAIRDSAWGQPEKRVTAARRGSRRSVR